MRGDRHSRLNDVIRVGGQAIWQRKVVVYLTLQSSTKQNRTIRRTELRDPFLNQWAEMSHEALDGPCRGVSEGTDCAAFDLFSGVFFF
jgi:hypothetical protein